MAAGTVRMLVLKLFRSGGAHIDYLNIKGQGLPSQGVIGIDIGAVPAGLDNRNSPHALAGAELDNRTGAQLTLEGQVLHRHTLGPLRIALSVCILWSQLGREHIARYPARHGSFQPGYHIIMAVQVGAGLAAAGGFQLDAVPIAQGIVETDNHS